MSEQKDTATPDPEAAKADSAKDDPKIEISESDAAPDELRSSDPGDDKPAEGAAEAAKPAVDAAEAVKPAMDAAEAAKPDEASAEADDAKIDVTVTDPVADDAPEVEPEVREPPPVPMKMTSSLPPRVWPPRTIADLMTRKVITLPETEPIGELEGWMNRFRFHHLPVVGEGMKLVGIISRPDLLHAMIGVGPDGKPVEKATAETLAGAIMNRNVVTAQPDAPLTTACRVMLQEKLGCLPVILENGTLVGILTGTDFARLALEVLERFAAKT